MKEALNTVKWSYGQLRNEGKVPNNKLRAEVHVALGDLYIMIAVSRWKLEEWLVFFIVHRHLQYSAKQLFIIFIFVVSNHIRSGTLTY